MRRIPAIIASVLLLVLLSACGSQEQQAESNHPKYKLRSDQDAVYVGFALDTLQEQRWYRDKDAFENKVKALGGNVKTLASNGDQEVQLQQVNLLIKEGVDVLVVVPVDAVASGEIVTMAHAAGIKVVSYDRLILNADLDYYVSFDNHKVGQLQAQYIVDKVKSGNIAYVGGSPSDNNAKLIREGSLDVLQPLIDNGSIKLVYDKLTDSWSGDIAAQQIKAYFNQGGERFDGIVTGYDGLARGAIEAIGDQAGAIPVSGQDAELDALQRIMKGTQTMTVYKSLTLIGEQAASLAVEIGSGQTAETTTTIDNGEKKVPAILLEPVAVTKDNMEETVIKDGHYTSEQIHQPAKP
ncbi:sugar ABC transporter substrate-binding protein [Paenibacillus xanthanilyticus]|uniref:Sugar ABC transporter substrate-binding protein n=1 Tax=Paenibacillus xanthanilyticus TaxID=1783531 RepID=A0ABV8K6F9_9BACL